MKKVIAMMLAVIMTVMLLTSATVNVAASTTSWSKKTYTRTREVQNGVTLTYYMRPVLDDPYIWAVTEVYSSITLSKTSSAKPEYTDKLAINYILETTYMLEGGTSYIGDHYDYGRSTLPPFDDSPISVHETGIRITVPPNVKRYAWYEAFAVLYHDADSTYGSGTPWCTVGQVVKMDQLLQDNGIG